MKRILVVDDDDTMRELLRARLSHAYELFDTGDPEQAVTLAIQCRPHAILLDLMMPRLSGIQVCRNLQAISQTALIPIFVITGESSARYQELCHRLGARGFFSKPLDFQDLQKCLDRHLQFEPRERRRYPRVRMSVTLVLRGANSDGIPFEECTSTENVSAAGFLSNCIAPFQEEAKVDVYFVNNQQQWFVGRARVVRLEPACTPWRRCAFQFDEPMLHWFL
jgi:DNA-binding response OmpR family regulator